MGVFDKTDEGERAGCPDLFKTVTRVRPALHCFGQIHEAWGAKSVRWKNELIDGKIEEPSHFNAIDNLRSEVIGDLSSLRLSKHNTPETTRMKEERKAELERLSYVDFGSLATKEVEIYFVNASVLGDGELTQKPFCATIKLPRAE
jgi:hypothetical protein